MLATLAACSRSKPPISKTKEELAKEALIQRGRAVYLTSCVACHDTDSKKPGTLGPEVYGSSKELIEARLMRAEYPEGYTPKRRTRLMPPLPRFKDEVSALHAYLNK